jgi:hypothetical protein
MSKQSFVEKLKRLAKKKLFVKEKELHHKETITTKGQ